MPKTDHHTLEKQTEREKALAAERKKLLILPPEQALEAIANHPLPVSLVQSMAEEDLHLLIHAIGLDDALQVMGLASNEQWQYLLDMETWQRDHLDPMALTQWFDRLLKADPDRFTHWIANEQREMFEYYLFHNIELYVREYEVDPGEIGEGFFSEDQVHYFRLRPFAPAGEETHPQQEQRDQLINDLLKRISVYDFPLYQTLLLESAGAIPSEVEEELLRLRTMRLAEKGFLPFEEAVGVYQPLTIKELLQRHPKSPQTSGRPAQSYPLRLDPTVLPDTADYFTRTLFRLQDQATLQRLQAEFAGLCNQVIVADQKKIAEKEVLSQVVAKVSGYISIGLEQADAEAAAPDPYRGANLIQNYLLSDLFRVGYGCALNLKWQAERWRRESWFNKIGLKPAFWGEAWLGVLGGLLIKKPLFFDNYASGKLYREFASLAEIQHCRQVLEQIRAWDDLLALMAVEVPPLQTAAFLTYQNLIFTLWADHCLDLETSPLSIQPLSLEQFQHFFSMLWEPGATPRRIRKPMREAFLNWLAVRGGLKTFEISQRMGSTLEELFILLENEMGALTAESIDPRHIQLFLFRAEP
ncbi:MAG: DUF6178 family protein [Desulfobacteraceae bacterium]|nr:DUF6178 family protein [Desulfobacteraceae bacterium]